MFSRTDCKNTVSALSLGVLITTTACSPFSGPFSGSSGPSSNYCIASQASCVMIGAVVLAGIVAFSGGSGMSSYPYVMSDERVKTDIRKIRTLDNGITVYSFRYIGDDRLFAGVLAQELQKDPRYAHAVMPNDQGYLVVEYGLLPLKGVDMELMIQAGIEAAERLKAT